MEEVTFFTHMIAFTDGASNPHKKRSGVGITWFYPKQLIDIKNGTTLINGEKPCASYSEEIYANRPNIQYPTNNDAEYVSLIKALEIAINVGCEKITVFMDSKLIVCQVNNLWNINHDHLRNYKKKIDELKKNIKLELYHVKREYNTWADYFSKFSIDETTAYQDKKFEF